MVCIVVVRVIVAGFFGAEVPELRQLPAELQAVPVQRVLVVLQVVA